MVLPGVISEENKDEMELGYNTFNVTSSTAQFPEESQAKSSEENIKTLPRWIYHGIMIFMIVVATIVISCNAPTEGVIQIAQVFNGCLLPFFSTCLLLCLNDPQFMGDTPQKWLVFSLKCSKHAW